MDRHADLWAVGVTLYEMVAGVPPYQAQDTRKLEALIQSRRPPRALPESCPDAMTAILHKALAGDLHQRYVSASAFESDVTLFLQEPADGGGNGAARFVEEQSDRGEAALPHMPERVASMAETVRRSVLKLKPARAQQLASVMSILVALCWGLLAGLVVCVPLGYYYRFWRESDALRGTSGFHARERRRDQPGLGSVAARPEAECVSGRYVAGQPSCARTCARHFLQAGERGDRAAIATTPIPRIEDFDWPKAAVCFTHLIEMDRNDRSAQGKLALCHGYENLERRRTASSAQADFEERGVADAALARSASGPRSDLCVFAEEHRQGDGGAARRPSAWVLSRVRAKRKRKRTDIDFAPTRS